MEGQHARDVDDLASALRHESRGCSLRQVKTAPTLTASTLSQSDAGCSSGGARRMIPALFTRMSIRPSASTTDWIGLSSSCGVASRSCSM